MTQPYYPFYWSDYSGKTMHLTQGQHGAFMLLMRWIYTTEKPIPDKQRYSIARALLEQEQSNVDEVLEQFFFKDGDVWRQDRCEQVIKKANDQHLKRVNAGKSGGLNKAAMLKQCPSNATAMLKQPEPEPEPKKKGKLASPSIPVENTDSEPSDLYSQDQANEIYMEGKVIRLTYKAYYKWWKSILPMIENEDDFYAILHERDDWLSMQAENSKRTWYISTSAYLKNKAKELYQ